MADWKPPIEFPDLRNAGTISLDSETKDDRFRVKMGPGWPHLAGQICGVSVAWRDGDGIHGNYFPIRHPDSENFNPAQVYKWVKDHVAAGVRIAKVAKMEQYVGRGGGGL
jgi:hypothetical protein